MLSLIEVPIFILFFGIIIILLFGINLFQINKKINNIIKKNINLSINQISEDEYFKEKKD